MLLLLLKLVSSDPEYRNYLKSLYRDHTSFTYKNARVLMYNELDCYDDKIFLLYGNDTYDWKCHTASGDIPNAQSVNAEHVVPQSTFNEKAPMVSDLHHLISSDSPGNNARSNYPFGELEDMTKCKKFCRNFVCTGNVPSSDIESYSCLFDGSGGTHFMPRGPERGVVARAVMYFYTVYDEYFDENDGGNTAAGHIRTFLDWNDRYPPMHYEQERNEKIAMLQGKRNPYVDNPAIARKAWSEFIK